MVDTRGGEVYASTSHTVLVLCIRYQCRDISIEDWMILDIGTDTIDKELVMSVEPYSLGLHQIYYSHDHTN